MQENYPIISQRKEPVLSLSIATKDKNSLVVIDKKLGEGVALNWVKAQLLDTYRILGASQVISSLQIVIMARRIRNIYFYLSPSELTYFFESVIGGGYGDIYVGKSINPQNLMQALRKFDTERANMLSDNEFNANEVLKGKSEATNIDIVNKICDAFKKKYIKEHVGCRAPNPYKSFKDKK